MNDFFELKVFFQNLPLLMMCFIRSPLLTLSLLQTAQLNTWLPVSTTKAVTRSSYLKSEHSATVLIHFTLAWIIHILIIGPFVHYKWISVLTFSIQDRNYLDIHSFDISLFRRSNCLQILKKSSSFHRRGLPPLSHQWIWIRGIYFI